MNTQKIIKLKKRTLFFFRSNSKVKSKETDPTTNTLTSVTVTDIWI
ncbi:hypothetical protein GJU39_00125 [Pedobacter petrophilus]|uniref:Uncharacterized protein n=1 Tax=Pedobacter petrophilus TaxID=1908241 RepID=A0A7K0FS88_9SPHI|nr:hypothetical protein [Pedobacter petrophilus]MRX74477.1 hypothetical protein [Pedobacter petrophilus]